MLHTLLFMALRNLLRHRARTLITFLAIFLGVFLTIVLSAFGNGLGVLMRDDVVFSKVGALQVHRKGYALAKDNQPLNYAMEAESLTTVLTKIPHVTFVAPRLVFSGLINNGLESTMIVGRGIDPKTEYQVLPWAKQSVVGNAIDDTKPQGGILGSELANALKAKESALVLQATTLQGQQNALDLELNGVLENTNVFESKRFVHVPLHYAQTLVRMPGKITEYALSIDNPDNAETIAHTIQQRLGNDYEVETWEKLQPNVADIIHFQAIIIGAICSIFLVIVIFGVMNTMMMSVLERKREMGTMMALGLKRKTITLLFLCEALILAFFASTAGIFLAQGFIALVTFLGGIRLAAPGSTVEMYHLIPIATWQVILRSFLGAVFGALIASAIPVYKASKLHPVDALRS